jgi:hypothetical protein
VVRRVVLIGVILLLPVAAFAQDAVLTGTVVDSTGAVLPGVTVTASNEATGNKFVGVTDERGIYRMPVRVGSYQVTAELQGFSTAMRAGRQPARRSDSVAQHAARSFDAAGNGDGHRRGTAHRLEELRDRRQRRSEAGPGAAGQRPQLDGAGAGRAGSRTDPFASGTAAQTRLPDRNGGEAREFQLNVDGQQVSADIGTGGQPKYSQDSIAEFQFVANRFDATMGRSTGVQVNAITKSGTNLLQGLVRGNFRDDKFNAVNPVLNRKEPIKNQQYSFTLGGPIVKDKLHFFGNYEYERQPQTAIFNTPYPAFNIDTSGTDTQNKGGFRLDYQLSTNTRVMGKVSRGVQNQPMVPGNTQSYASAVATNREYNDERVVNFTQVLSNKAVNEIKGGEAVFGLSNRNLTTWSNHWLKSEGINTGSPRITFRGFSIGGNQNYRAIRTSGCGTSATISPTRMMRRVVMTCASAASSCTAIRFRTTAASAWARAGQRTRSSRPPTIPTPAQMQAWFPDPFNADTWNLAAISPWVSSYSIGIGDFNVHLRSKKFASWLQDDWNISNRLTLNLGVRYDLEMDVFANNVEVQPFQQAGRPNDTKNVQPRLGFNFKANDSTVVRGGAGLYYGDAMAPISRLRPATRRSWFISTHRRRRRSVPTSR